MVTQPKQQNYSPSYLHPHPHPPRYHLPEEDQKAVYPIDGHHLLFTLYGSDYAMRHGAHIELIGKGAACNQWGAHKAWTDIGDGQMVQSTDGSQLGEAFEIMARKTFGR